MRKPEFRYMVLWIFLAGIIIIVFLQVISGYNINRLVRGNKSIFNELKVQNELRQIQADILTVESDVRGAVISKQQNRVYDVDNRISSILTKLNHLQNELKSPSTDTDFTRLTFLVNEKISFSRQILKEIYPEESNGKVLLINTNRGNEIRDSIINVISHLENSRQARLQQIIGSIGSTGKTARIWGVFVSGIALIAVIIAFWYIT
ncbi:MAG: CHASE3 domain-containing protein, partial [Flavisolibacter sp.]